MQEDAPRAEQGLLTNPQCEKAKPNIKTTYRGEAFELWSFCFTATIMRYTAKIKENKDFLTLYKKGKYTSGKFVTVYYKKNYRNSTRLGITTGKKIGNAVVRSRCRRIIRAAYAACENEFPRGFDYVVVARPECGKAKSTEIEAFFRKKAVPVVKDMKNSPKNLENKPKSGNKSAENNK